MRSSPRNLTTQRRASGASSTGASIPDKPRKFLTRPKGVTRRCRMPEKLVADSVAQGARDGALRPHVSQDRNLRKELPDAPPLAPCPFGRHRRVSRRAMCPRQRSIGSASQFLPLELPWGSRSVQEPPSSWHPRAARKRGATSHGVADGFARTPWMPGKTFATTFGRRRVADAVSSPRPCAGFAIGTATPSLGRPSGRRANAR